MYVVRCKTKNGIYNYYNFKKNKWVMGLEECTILNSPHQENINIDFPTLSADDTRILPITIEMCQLVCEPVPYATVSHMYSQPDGKTIISVTKHF